MSKKQKAIAMLLAGGQGSRLGILTKKLAKPAIPFGGKYRIIDFTLSNCVNSGIETVGILTQYQPLILNEYISDGKAWDLDCINGGVQILPPFKRIGRSDWYKGTANAIYQNLNYIERYNPEYVVILSGDHIYKMDYSDMIHFHVKNKAVCTISVIEIAKEEAKRFGIVNATSEGLVYNFEEKPAHPKSFTASMGIYVFNTSTLKEYLLSDELDQTSSNDFGKDVIPTMIKNKERVFAYKFSGYWKDVGTIESLWEANMDLLRVHSSLNLNDNTWKIYSHNQALPPHYIGESATIHDSLISDGCKVYGTVKSSILFPGVYIDKDSIIRDSIVMPYTKISEGCIIDYAIIGSNVFIDKNIQIGNRPEHLIDKAKWHISVVESENVLKSNLLPDDQNIHTTVKNGNESMVTTNAMQ